MLRGEWVDPSAGRTAFAEFASLWLANRGHLRRRTIELYRYLLGSHVTPLSDSASCPTITNSQVVDPAQGTGREAPGHATHV